MVLGVCRFLWCGLLFVLVGVTYGFCTWRILLPCCLVGCCGVGLFVVVWFDLLVVVSVVC